MLSKKVIKYQFKYLLSIIGITSFAKTHLLKIIKKQIVDNVIVGVVTVCSGLKYLPKLLMNCV